MTAQLLQLIRGNSSDIYKLGVKNHILDDTWTCKVVIKKDYAEVKALEKNFDFDATDKLFKGLITPTESAALVEGDYMLTFAFENTVLLFKKEIQYKLRVLPSGVL